VTAAPPVLRASPTIFKIVPRVSSILRNPSRTIHVVFRQQDSDSFHKRSNVVCLPDFFRRALADRGERNLHQDGRAPARRGTRHKKLPPTISTRSLMPSSPRAVAGIGVQGAFDAEGSAIRSLISMRDGGREVLWMFTSTAGARGA